MERDKGEREGEGREKGRAGESERRGRRESVCAEEGDG